MSLDIDKIILHSLRLDAEGRPRADSHSQLLVVDDAVQGLMAELHRIYNGKGGKGFGYFPAATDEEEAPDPRFRDALTALRQGALDFVPFSEQLTGALVETLVRHGLDEHGVLLVARYQYVGVDYLLLALLDSKESVTVSDRLELRHIQYLDIGKMNLVARVDLTEWQTQGDSRRYVTFSKGRVGRKLGDLFIELFGIREGMDPKLQNKGLLQAVEEYCETRQMPAEESREYKKQVFKYCTEQASAGEEIELRELSAELPGKDDLDFYSFVGDEYQLEERFPVDRSTLRGLTKFVGSGGGLTLSFDQKLLGSRVFYDPDTDTLTVKGVPPNLKDQLLRQG
ncbi:nucleoid-associated protein YejK [Aeromonas schubertii]|uniref:Nucleoid-associated protein NdpA n=1 Tax=Aeromonas schubertii TaxID=652 RepID=A0A0S2SKU1_9GAMM|nr:nucleoid-associated protein YejK [Aeromonas schubertii]ALP42336.1 nucleoid-associated protein NdpA [Aeromonas schubertii]MBZ6066233.1 nucleoid-associated protein YejK [Aeromonas schubertii]